MRKRPRHSSPAGISRRRKLRRPRWTEAELAVLGKLYRTRSNAEIARVLGRKVSSIVFKAHRLGLAKGARRLREMGKENVAKRWRARKPARRRKPSRH